MIRIAVDAMGGDHAPGPEVEGSIQAANELGVEVVLVGAEARLREELRRKGWHGGRGIDVLDATEVITMSDPVAQAIRRKRNSSLHVAAQEVAEGRADGLVSAGNTGAVMGVAMIKLGYVSGNRMTNVRAGNEKLKDRAVRILMTETGIEDRDEAEALLIESQFSISQAIAHRKDGDL